MSIIQTLKTKLGGGSIAAGKAYRLWAETYDRQPDNLMFALDRKAVSALLAEIGLQGKRVLDIGCGTGRLWPLLKELGAAEIEGCDASPEMLARLRAKFPEATIHQAAGPGLPFLGDHSSEVVLSTLTLAHLEQPTLHFREWARILSPGGWVVLTDLHPASLVRGAQRSFTHKGKTLRIQNHVHALEKVREAMTTLGFREHAFRETAIDDALKDTYRRHGLSEVFEQFRGTPIHFAISWCTSP